MASCTTSEWVNTAPKARLTVTESSSTDTTVTLRWVLQVILESAPSTGAHDHAFTVKIDGQTINGGYDIPNSTGTFTADSGYVTVNKSSSARSVSFSVAFAFNLTWSGVYGGTKSASGSISIAAKTITYYTIYYNANGGSGAPSSQTKQKGSSIKLSNTSPTRSGYAFLGWGTSASDTSVNYSPGATYSSDASITLYAIWSANAYTITYNPNASGVTGMPANQAKTHGVTLKLSSAEPSRQNYTFIGWGLTASSTTATYDPGDNYTANASEVLYAIWSIAYTKPKITNVSVERNNDDGDSDDNGTKLRVGFSWTSDKNVSSVTIQWKPTNESNWTTYTLNSSEASGKTGIVDKFFNEHEFSTDFTYEIQITVTDPSGFTTTSRMVSGLVFPVDVLPENKGISFGKPAEIENAMDVGYECILRHETRSYHNDTAYIHHHEASGITVGFGVGSGGANHGIYNSQFGRWIFYNNGTDTFLGDSRGNFKPYFSPGTNNGSFNVAIRTAGYVTNDGKDVNFVVPLSKPLNGVSTVTVASNTGLILRSNSKYSHGSAASTRVFPTSYTAEKTTAGYIMVKAVFDNNTNVTNNSAIGIDANITITFA